MTPPFDRRVHRIPPYIVQYTNTGPTYDGHTPYRVADRTVNSVAAMRLVKAHTSIPTATLFYSDQDIIIQQDVPGVQLHDLYYKMSPEALQNIMQQVRAMIVELARIPVPSPPAIQTASGDRNLTHDSVDATGPSTYQPLYSMLTDADPTKLIFAHLDLHPSNIIVSRDGSKVAALIDWECAAWVPAKVRCPLLYGVQV